MTSFIISPSLFYLADALKWLKNIEESNYPLRSELQLHSVEIGRVRVAEVGRAAAGVCFVMNSVPNYLIVPSCGDTSADGEDKLPIEGFFEEC